jgi:hypothetical protein
MKKKREKLLGLLLNELKAAGILVGLLINFGQERLELFSQIHPRSSAAKAK